MPLWKAWVPTALLWNISLDCSVTSCVRRAVPRGTVLFFFFRKQGVEVQPISKPHHLENYKGFILNYSVGEPKTLVLTAFLSQLLFQEQEEEVSQLQRVCVGVCVGACLSETAARGQQGNEGSQAAHPAHLEVAQTHLVPLPEPWSDSARQNEPWGSVHMDPSLVAEQI